MDIYENLYEKRHSIANHFNYRIKQELSNENNYNGFVFLLDDGKIMKLSFFPCYKTIEKIASDSQYPNIYAHSIISLNHSQFKDVDMYIRDDIHDIPEEHKNFFIFFEGAYYNLLDDYSRIDPDLNISDFFYFAHDNIEEQDDYIKLSEDEKQLCNLYLNAIQHYSELIGKLYRDVCFDNFGIYNDNYIIRDFEGYQDADKEKILNNFSKISLNELEENITFKI